MVAVGGFNLEAARRQEVEGAQDYRGGEFCAASTSPITAINAKAVAVASYDKSEFVRSGKRTPVKRPVSDCFNPPARGSRDKL